uniref:Nuclear receptor domain-containing protein n=1 Tax=Syphacia muris TaxID=451379 RepID=A0A0N5ADY4_9BILA
MPAKKNTDGRCQICNDAGHGYHFGVIACRACAAFFRRTVALNLKYRCRFDEQCPINKSVRCMCRKCRLAKCLKMGMNPQSVQLNRDPIGHNPHKERSTVIVQQSSPSSSSASSIASPNCVSISSEDIDAKVYKIFEQASVQQQINPGSSILEKMLRAYHEIDYRRQFIHGTTWAPEPLRSETEEEKAKRWSINCNIFNTIIANEIQLTAHMVVNFYPFMELPLDQRMILFKHFLPRYLRIERAFATYLKLGPDTTDERTVFYNGIIAHKSSYTMFLSNISKLSEDEIKRFVSGAQEASWSFVRTPLKLLKPTEYEFIAMCGYLLWTIPGLKGVEQATVEKARKARDQIFTALHQYYTEVLSLPAYAPRLAECMSLLSAVEVVLIL